MLELCRIGNNQCRFPILAARDVQDGEIPHAAIEFLRRSRRTHRAGLG